MAAGMDVSKLVDRGYVYALRLRVILISMGVNGLWEVVEPVKHVTSFRGLATEQGFGRKYRGIPVLHLGVDASLFICAATAAAKAGTVHSQAENVAVKNFFYRLCRLLDIPATFIFVFDGPARPAVKRGTHVTHKAPWVAKYAEALIEGFGFYCHQAPGEAEAELAELNQHGFIDGIISNDSDVLVFGGLNVIRLNMSSSADPDRIAVYYSDVLEHSDEVNMSRADMVFYALCAGGDYSSGIPGCGAALAHGLAKAGHGKHLVDAASSLDSRQFHHFLATWRRDLQHELRSNPNHLFASLHPMVANAITDAFPSTAILQLYLHPTTSFNLGSPPPSHKWSWLPQLPRIFRLAKFCSTHFDWDNAAILKRFRTHLWRGVALRLCMSPLSVYIRRTGLLSAVDLRTTISKIAAYVPSQDGVPDAVKLTLTTSSFVAAMGPQWHSQSKSAPALNVEIPRIVFEKLNGPVILVPDVGPSSLGVIDLTDSDMEEEEVVSEMKKEPAA